MKHKSTYTILKHNDKKDWTALCPRIQGREVLEKVIESSAFMIISSETGTGKIKLLNRLLADVLHQNPSALIKTAWQSSSHGFR